MSNKLVRHDITDQAAIIESLQWRINSLEESLKRSEFKAAVAEWALAGLMSRNLHLSQVYDDSQAKDRVEMARHIGKVCGSQFLRGAELEFKQHADYAAMQMNQLQSFVRQPRPDALPEPVTWPRPF